MAANQKPGKQSKILMTLTVLLCADCICAGGGMGAFVPCSISPDFYNISAAWSTNKYDLKKLLYTELMRNRSTRKSVYFLSLWR